MDSAWRSRAGGVAFIVLLTIAAYLPAIRGGFIWDDDVLITENRLIKAGDGIYRFWLTTEPDDYWPLTSTVWWLEWRLWGSHPMGYHMVNVLLHALNAVLVWMILSGLRVPGAWLAALVFAVHPVNVATAGWISEQKNTQSMFFFALAVLLYLRFDEDGHWRWYGLSWASFLLAMLSKAAVVMLPVVLLGCIWWRRSHVRWKDCLSTVPFFVLSLGLGLVTMQFQQRHAVAVGALGESVGFPSRLAMAGSVPWFYLYKALLPVHLTAIYSSWQIHDLHWTSYVPGTILVGGLALCWWKRDTWGRPLFFGLGYFVTMLFPVLGFFNQSFHRLSPVADHWQYYSIVGPIAVVIGAMERVARRWGEQSRPWWTAFGAAVVVMLGVATWARACVYADPYTFWRDNVTKNPGAYVAHNGVGIALWQAGKLEDAVGHFEEAVRLKPDFFEAHYNLGCAMAQQGRMERAINEFEQTLRLKPNDAAAHNNLANTFIQANRVPEAVEHYEYALRLQPDNAEAHCNLGIALAEMGSFNSAIDHFEQALRLKPDFAEAKRGLARLKAVR